MDIGKAETCVKYTRVILKPAQKMSILIQTFIQILNIHSSAKITRFLLTCIYFTHSSQIDA